MLLKTQFLTCIFMQLDNLYSFFAKLFSLLYFAFLLSFLSISTARTVCMMPSLFDLISAKTTVFRAS